VADEWCAIPIYVRRERKVGDTLYVAMEDPTNDEALRRVVAASGMPVKPMIAATSEIRAAIRAYYGGERPATLELPTAPTPPLPRGGAGGSPHAAPVQGPAAPTPPLPRSGGAAGRGAPRSGVPQPDRASVSARDHQHAPGPGRDRARSGRRPAHAGAGATVA